MLEKNMLNTIHAMSSFIDELLNELDCANTVKEHYIKKHAELEKENNALKEELKTIKGKNFV